MCTICAALRPLDEDCGYDGLAGNAAYFEGAIDAAQDSSTIYSMAVGDTFSGTISSVAERDWVAVTLTQGETYDITVRGGPSGLGTLSDTVMALYDSAGVYIQGNDDGGLSTESALSFTATETGTYYIMARGYQSKTGTYEIGVTDQSPPPPPPPPAAPVMGDLDALSSYLTTGYWLETGSAPHRFNTSFITQISVNITDLTAEGQQLARWAFEAWEAVANIDFVETSGSALITFDDDRSGASAGYSYSGSYTISSNVNVSTSWLTSYGTQIGSYSFQTYLHEVGHALGLGHLGNYNGSASFGSSNTFLNDSWQMSVMSYFSQTQNTEITASRAEAVTAMIADVDAIQALYGAAGAGSLTAGSTVYGVGHTLGNSWLGRMFDEMDGTGLAGVYDGGPVAMTIHDITGIDLIDFSSDTQDQRVDLRSEAISDVAGQVGNLLIARDTWIEHYSAGSGDDTVQGNARKNTLQGNDGADTLEGLGGNDLLLGGADDDTLMGGAGFDTLIGGSGADTLRGGAQADTLMGGAQGDTLIGGGGFDTASYAEAAGGVIVDMINTGRNTGEAAGDSYQQIEYLLGGTGDDTMSGNRFDNRIEGADGNDRLQGRVGDDTLLGGAGRDALLGGADNDRMTGGAGRDTFVFTTGVDVITDFTATPGADQDRLQLSDALWGGVSLSTTQILSFADVVTGDTVFDFGGGNALILEGHGDLAALDPLLGFF